MRDTDAVVVPLNGSGGQSCPPADAPELAARWLEPAIVVAGDGTRHLEAAIGADLTACGYVIGLDGEVHPTGNVVTCRPCADALRLADALSGSSEDLRVLAGAALLAADRLDPTGGSLEDGAA